MSKYFVPDTTFGMDAECAVCCCLWTDPVEVKGCQHIFCRGCVEGLDKCPVCCGPVEQLHTPGKFILRLLHRTQGSCSACAWKGTYSEFKDGHVTCLPAGEEPPDNEDACPTTAECVTMQEYYLESGCRNGDAGVRRTSTAMLPGVTGGGVGGSSARRFSHVANTATPTADVRPTREQRTAWRQSLTSTAHDYGMAEKEYRELMERFADFAVPAASGSRLLELRWRDACRLLRFFNYPNHPDDVKSLFEMARRNPVTESVPFHALCLWLMLNRRNPAQWYRMTVGPYEQMLQVAQLLDVEATGLFTLEQCRILAEQYFERDVSDAEWNRIEPLLRGKDAEIRHSFLGTSTRRRADLGESAILSTVKLPFHDAVCAFTRHVDVLKKEQQQSTQQRTQADYVRRIKRIVGYYEPDAASQVEATLQKFTGEEESLLMTLTAMYGPEPP
ncbi:hypothetical protein NESM_000589800 [Novymonas esmeraldas]|uniref:RING-type domain-containing protein n=1 Tax=Novymonas esmeraldas TaxID=1808958 RepID=A0AAW0ESM1_9TRYP